MKLAKAGKITLKEQPDDVKRILNTLTPTIQRWFFSRFKEFSLPQLFAVYDIHCRQNILVSAPTGATKTLTGFLSILNELVDLSEKGALEDRVYCVYISPLKALNYDIEHNLNRPLKEIEALAGERGIRVGVRTGDTTTQERAKMTKIPPHILITTPESLAILLQSKNFREHLRNVDWMIIDEIHALAENKRGVHLSLSMEMLQRLSPGMCRVGLSATIAPLEDIAGYLVGSERDCRIVDVQFIKQLDLKVLSPVPNLVDTTHERMHQKMYDLIDGLIQQHKTTLIFTNTRAATERIVHYLKDTFPKNYTDVITPADDTDFNAEVDMNGNGNVTLKTKTDDKETKTAEQPKSDGKLTGIGAHHGSLSKTHRHNIEQGLREGKLKCVVCLDGGTKVLNSDGTWVRIKDVHKNSVQSIGADLKVGSNKIKNIFRTKNADGLLKLKTVFGKEIVCTKNHKFLTIDGAGELIWKEAAKLEEEDFVATIRRYDYVRSTEDELNKFLFENYPDNYYAFLKGYFLKDLRTKIKTQYVLFKRFWEEHFKEDISDNQFNKVLAGKYPFKIGVLKKVCMTLSIDDLEVFQAIVAVSSAKYRMEKPTFSKSLMRLIGFMLADGYLSDERFFVSNKDKTVLKRYGKIIKRLSSREPFFKLSSTGTPILVWSSMFLVGFLKNLGFKIGRKARVVNIPNFIFRLPSDRVFEFLSGYWDGDGYVERKKDNRVYAAGFCTTSKEMAEDISRLLLREGILSSIRSRYYDEVRELKTGRSIVKKGWFYDVVVLGGDNLRKFAANMTPVRQNLRVIKNVLAQRGYTNRDVIPNLGKKLRNLRNKVKVSTYKLQKSGLNPIKYELGTRCISRKQLSRLLSIYNSNDEFLLRLTSSDLFWERIQSKKWVKPTEFVYNIEVETDHNYVANSFLTKNCSTSLELGIDIGYIDLVILLGSPKSVARALQRVGRSGHQLHSTTKGRIVVLNRDDLVECSVLLKSAMERKIDRIHIPENCLDVLSQQIYGICITERLHVSELLAMVRQSYCFRSLSDDDFYSVIHYLSGDHVSLEDRHVYGKIWHDPDTGMVGRKGKLASVIYMTNIGTIPDSTGVTVKVGAEIIGMIDESFLERLKRGDIFVLGGSTYEFQFSSGMVAQVKPAIGRKPTVPSWFSEMLPLSFDLAQEIGKFRRLMRDKFKSGMSQKDVLDFINSYLYVDENAANAIYEYMREQYDFAVIPNDKDILIEQYNDEDKKYAVFHTMYGRRVNDCLSRSVAFVVSKTLKRDVEIGITDNGFYIASKKAIPAARAFSMLESKRFQELLELALDKTQVLSRRFRHCAGRSLMILRSYKGHHKRVGKQQVSSMILMSAVRRISKDFPILKEAKREVLEDLMDVNNATRIIRMVENGSITVKSIDTTIPSPFAFNLVLQGHLDMIRMEDRIEFLKRMHKLVLAKISLDQGKKGNLDEDVKQVYDELWKDLEIVDTEKGRERERLTRQAWNLKKVPMFAKKEIVRLIDGERTGIRKDFIAAFHKHEEDIKSTWPRDLRLVISKAVKEVEEQES
ncbi:MAG: DEAD/DEAH box helicase [Candidatus Woesearchaeota archaeon]